MAIIISNWPKNLKHFVDNVNWPQLLLFSFTWFSAKCLTCQWYPLQSQSLSLWRHSVWKMLYSSQSHVLATHACMLIKFIIPWTMVSPDYLVWQTCQTLLFIVYELVIFYINFIYEVGIYHTMNIYLAYKHTTWFAVYLLWNALYNQQHSHKMKCVIN